MKLAIKKNPRTKPANAMSIPAPTIRTMAGQTSLNFKNSS